MGGFKVRVCVYMCVCWYRARQLKVVLKKQNAAATVIASHVRKYLQQKKYLELKERHKAATTIQAAFRYIT